MNLKVENNKRGFNNHKLEKRFLPPFLFDAGFHTFPDSPAPKFRQIFSFVVCRLLALVVRFLQASEGTGTNLFLSDY